MYANAYRLLRDAVFWPQDDTHKSLPLFDFLDGNVRVTVPWRAVATWRFTGGKLNVVGVDRYNLVREDGEWRIARIDTDGDNLLALLSLSPFRIPFFPSQRVAERLYKIARVLRIARDVPEEEYRAVLGSRFDKIKKAYASNLQLDLANTADSKPNWCARRSADGCEPLAAWRTRSAPPSLPTQP